MRVGIVTPTYTIERYLPETLASMSCQTHQDWRAVVVDDGSTDGTVAVAHAIAAKDSRIEVLQQTNQGGAAARERGYDHLGDSVDAVLFFDHDDRLRPEALATLVRLLEENPDAPAAYGLAAYMDPEGQLVRPGAYESYLRNRRRVVATVANPDHPDQFRLERVSRGEPVTYEALMVNNWVPIGGILIRKSARDALGRFDAATNYAHDWDYWIRLSLLGPIPCHDEPVYDYRVHPSAMSRAGDRLESGQVDVWTKFITSSDVPRERRLQALAAYRLVHREMLARKQRKALRRYLRLQFEEGRSIARKARAAAERFSDDAWQF